MKNKKLKKLLTIAVFCSFCINISACKSDTSNSIEDNTDKITEKSAEPNDISTLPKDLNLSNYKDKWIYYEEYNCYGLENIIYCEKPIDAKLECMNIYVPAVYIDKNGNINTENKIKNYNAETAPIIYANGVWGYAEYVPSTIDGQNAEYLEKGYIYISVGSRGKESKSEDGIYIGKSPEGLVDLKAGVRFLKANDAILAGNSNHIISIGTSAGGAMSSLLGATGNSADYNQYLEEIGAVMTAADNVYASQCYCPITDLDHADMAYEWMFANDITYENPRGNTNGELTDFEQALSKELSSLYISYINDMGLTNPETGENLILGKDGRSGTLYDYMINLLEKSATDYLTKLAYGKLSVDYTVEDYINGNYTVSSSMMKGMGRGQRVGAEKKDSFDKPVENTQLLEGTKKMNSDFAEEDKQGTDKSAWLLWDGTKASITSFDDYLSYNLGRMKTCLAFDNLKKEEAENQEFGDNETDTKHFDSYIAPIIEKLKKEFPDEYRQYYKEYASVLEDERLTKQKYLLNPFNYIGTEKECDTAQYFRIRVGSQDADTSFLISLSLGLKLQNTENVIVDYDYVWDQGHGNADYEGDLYSWIEEICK